MRKAINYQEIKKTPVLIVLKIPPPFGGGEILCDALSKYVKNDDDFVTLEISSKSTTKGDQGRFNFWKIFEFFTLWRKLISIIIRKRPSLVFCPIAKSFPHFFRDSILFWTSWIFRIPFAGELAGATFYFLGKNRLQTFYGKMVLTRFACLRVLGNSVALHLKKFGISNTIVTDNGIESTGPCRQQQPKLDKNLFRILFVGTISEQKGFSTLVDACCKLVGNGDLFQIHVMGEWISENYKLIIENTINRAGIKDRFVFYGLKHGQEKKEIFCQSDVLILPSFFEGQPLVILEALSCGMPIVSTNVGGIPDTIEDGKNGFLIEPGDAGALKNKILLLMKDPDLWQKMSEENLRLYQERFTQEAFLKTQVYWIKQCARGELNPHGQFIRYPH